jgi:putative protease
MSDDEVHAALRIAHGGGAKLRVAVNTNLQSHEIAPMLRKMERFVSWGVDGAIMTDVGAIAEVHRRFPDLTIHASIGATSSTTRTCVLSLHRRLAGRGRHEADS